MDNPEHDPVTGRHTTGHEWNGIKELDTPIPRIVLFFLAAGALFSLVWWVLMPAWPLGTTYTRGLLGLDQREVVTREVQLAAAERAVWMDRIAAEPFEAIVADPALMGHVMDAGPTLFADNCGVCHGVSGTGGPGFPDLTAGVWLWGGDPETVAETIRIGINSHHEESRASQMLPFGRLGVLNREQVRAAAIHVRSLSGQTMPDVDQAVLDMGREVYAANCAACHGAEGRGDAAFGAPDLTDDRWLYGGDLTSVIASIHGGRQGHMPHWEGRLTPAEIRLLAVYVGALAEGGR